LIEAVGHRRLQEFKSVELSSIKNNSAHGEPVKSFESLVHQLAPMTENKVRESIDRLFTQA
jgi:hypothetical protein